MRRIFASIASILCVVATGLAQAADTVPNEVQQPGTQPREIGNLESPDKCDNCHGGYDLKVEPAHNWRGSMMANAGRDPIFWATLAVVEQDFDGAGDLCIRCHSTAGWLAGRSTPTDGSGLAQGDADGVECEFCHKATNPDNTEHVGVQLPPFLANDSGDPLSDPGNVLGYYGSGMASMWGGSDKLGPYIDADARHQFMQSRFHRDVDFCGTCHDVSNPAVGDLAHNNGAQETAEPVFASGVLGGPVEDKAAFNNLPYKYGIVERTFSEFKAGLLSQTPVSAYGTLPDELKAGAIRVAYESSIVAGTGGRYQDQTERYFSCQTCHMRPVTGVGCNKNPPARKDLPLHDMTGGNYWMPDAIRYLDGLGLLRLGGGLSAAQIAALNDGKTRALKQLSEAVSLQVNGNTVKVINLTGHKLISGYPEGRRMWLNVKWYDADNNLVGEDGAYGPLVDGNGQPVTVTNPADGQPVQVESILDLHYPNIYEAHYALTKEWAQQLISLGYPGSFALSHDRTTGAVDYTLGQLADAGNPDTYHETFHFVLNNKVAKDNRIPPYGMDAEAARVRNALPVPADQYGVAVDAEGVPVLGSVYNYFDEVALAPPPNAVYATIDMLYQPTSWEYIQFLWLANNGTNAFLADEGVNLLNAWLNTGMAAPYVMTSTTWGQAPTPPVVDLIVDSLTTWSVDKRGNFVATTSDFSKGDVVGIVAHTVDPAGNPLSGCQVFTELRDAQGTLLTTLQGFSDEQGDAKMTWKSPRRTAVDVTATVLDALKNGYAFNPAASQTTVAFSVR